MTGEPGPSGRPVSRRTLITAAAALADAAAIAPRVALAAHPTDQGQTPPGQGTPPSVISSPPRPWGPDAQPQILPDPDVIVVDPSFANYRLALSSIQRVWTGGRWLEGPAWSSQGNYLVFSDVHTDTEYRLIWTT
jgi:gluconolactonase